MAALFALSIRGKTLFFSGTIPEDKYEDIERIANEVMGSVSREEYVQHLIENVFCELKIKLEYCPIAYVFRVRRNDGHQID